MFSLGDPHDVRQLARASRATISPTLRQITFSWLDFRSFTCLAGFFAGHHSQRTPRCHRRAGPKQKQRIIDQVWIQYNKECVLKWQVPKGKIFVFPKFQGNRSIISGDMTRGVYCVECEFGLRPFFFWWSSTHTHEWTQRGKIRRSKRFWERAEITVFVKYWSLFSLFFII